MSTVFDKDIQKNTITPVMFSSKERLIRKTGPFGVGRLSYLQSLVTEFQETDSEEAKLQILANLANFSYDPINYEYLKALNAVDLFLDCLTEENEKLVAFATGGLCNIALEKSVKEYIVKNDGVKLLTQCLSRSDVETVANAMTALMFLMTPASQADSFMLVQTIKLISVINTIYFGNVPFLHELATPAIIDIMLRLLKSPERRLSNLANIYLQDYCPSKLFEAALQNQKSWTESVSSHQSNIGQ